MKTVLMPKSAEFADLRKYLQQAWTLMNTRGSEDRSISGTTLGYQNIRSPYQISQTGFHHLHRGSICGQGVKHSRLSLTSTETESRLKHVQFFTVQLKKKWKATSDKPPTTNAYTRRLREDLKKTL